jgi:hypothetical protein
MYWYWYSTTCARSCCCVAPRTAGRFDPAQQTPSLRAAVFLAFLSLPTDPLLFKPTNRYIVTPQILHRHRECASGQALLAITT